MLARTDQRVDILSMTRTFVLYNVSCELAHLQQGRGFFIFLFFNFPSSIFLHLKKGSKFFVL